MDFEYFILELSLFIGAGRDDVSVPLSVFMNILEYAGRTFDVFLANRSFMLSVFLIYNGT